MIINLITTIQLTRLTNAFAGVANLWLVVLWTRAQEHETAYDAFNRRPLWLLLGASVVLGVGLSMYGGSLNDVFDARRDRALAKGRPIPEGRVSPQSAALIGFVSLLASLVAAAVVGHISLLACLACATLILFFNTTARYVPSLALTSVAAIYGSHMLIVNLQMRFIWPIVLVMVHAAAVHGVAHVLERKRPRYTILTIIGATLGISLLVTALIARLGWEGPLWTQVVSPYLLTWPAAAVILFVLSSIQKSRYASGPAFAAEKLRRYGSLWMGLYGVAWLLGAGFLHEAAILGALVIMGVLWMMLVRDVGGLLERPLGYRW